jgi:hypothetical protein
MPAGLRRFAGYPPFTPLMETLRGLLLGSPIGDNAALAVAWCAGIAPVGHLWAKALFTRDPDAVDRLMSGAASELRARRGPRAILERVASRDRAMGRRPRRRRRSPAPATGRP